MVAAVLKPILFCLNRFPVGRRARAFGVLPNLRVPKVQGYACPSAVSRSGSSARALRFDSFRTGSEMEGAKFGKGDVQSEDLVEVTEENFETVFPYVEAALEKCDFFAIDGEFTGLFLANASSKENLFDSIEERYKTMKTSAENFLIIQFGLSTFQWKSSRNLYVAQTFNFYTFPRPYNSLDLRFVCQASSLEFLSRYGFDFNKLIYKGIPFLSLFQWEKEEAGLEQKKTNNPIVLRKQEDIQFANKQLKSVSSWVQSTTLSPPTQQGDQTMEVELNFSAKTSSSSEMDVEETLIFDSKQTLQLDSCNSYLRAFLYQQLEKIYGNNSFYAESIQTQEGSAVLLTRADLATIAKRNADKLKEKEMQFNKIVGFGRVMKLLTGRKKPMVGHNMILDLVFMMHQFIKPLPPTFEEFQKSVIQNFPGGIYDTKYLAKQFPAIFSNSGTSLQTVFSILTQTSESDTQHKNDGKEQAAQSTQIGGKSNIDDALDHKDSSSSAKNSTMKFDLSEENSKEKDESKLVSVFVPPIIHDENFLRYRDLPFEEAKAHEAGYDAFMTGSCFCTLIQLFSARNSVAMDSNGPPSMDPLLPHANKVNIMFSDMDYISLSGPCQIPDRSNIFVVEISDNSKYIQTDSIHSLCANTGIGDVAVKWINSRSFFVTVLDPEKVDIAREALGKNSLYKFHVKSFAEYEQEKSSKSSENGEKAELNADDSSQKSKRKREGDP